MDRKARTLSEPIETKTQPSAEVVPLNTTTTPDPAPPPTPPGRLHSVAIAGMAISALVGIASMLAFVTIGWPGDSGRYVIALFAMSVVGFMISGSAAVFAAARDTYPRGGGAEHDRDSGDL